MERNCLAAPCMWIAARLLVLHARIRPWVQFQRCEFQRRAHSHECVPACMCAYVFASSRARVLACSRACVLACLHAC
eukprot:7736325-Alexandrium_andersonii.AAC.1